MNLFPFLLERFIALCEIPKMYAGLRTKSVTLQIVYMDDREFSGYGIVVNCIDTNLAMQIFSHQSLLLAAIQELNLVAIDIFVENELFRRLSHRHSLENKNALEVIQGWNLEKLQNFRSPLSMAMSNQEFNLNSLANSPNAVYIVSMNGHKLLYANDAALLANQKTLDEFVGENIAGLSYPDEYQKMIQLLRIDGKLTNYQFKAMNWHKEGSFLRRQKVNLVSDLKIITFGKTECRMSMDLMVEETNHFID